MLPENTAVIGLQAGDEGKGKVVDILSGCFFDWVVRYQGGHNAGHTVQIGSKIYKLHLLPSGILQGKKCVLGNGMVINPTALVQEIEEIGIDPRGLVFVSDRATLIMPWHPLMEAMNSGHYGADSIGTTGRGIGPAYEDKAGRRAFKMWEPWNDFAAFRERVWKVDAEMRLRIGRGLPHAEIVQFISDAQKLVPLICDTRRELHYNRDLRRILFEGAQGHMLDIDHGTYPFVTSSNSTVGGICTGTGMPAKAIKNVLGVVKAYATRVGGGPFPTEDSGAEGDHMYQVGREDGTSTGRRRRCGWYDGVQVSEAVDINGVDALAVMKIDVLSGLSEVKICIGYERDGNALHYLPADPQELTKCKPVYDSVTGWKENLSEVRRYEDLPTAAQMLLLWIGNRSGAPVKLVSVGPERSQILLNPEADHVFPWMDSLLPQVLA